MPYIQINPAVLILSDEPATLIYSGQNPNRIRDYPSDEVKFHNGKLVYTDGSGELNLKSVRDSVQASAWGLWIYTSEEI